MAGGGRWGFSAGGAMSVAKEAKTKWEVGGEHTGRNALQGLSGTGVRAVEKELKKQWSQ